MKRLQPLLLISALGFSGATLSWSQSQSLDPASGKGTVQSETAESPASKAKTKTKSGSSPREQIKEGGIMYFGFLGFILGPVVLSFLMTLFGIYKQDYLAEKSAV